MKNLSPRFAVRSLFVLLVFSGTLGAQTPSWQWAKSAGTTGAEAAASTALDASGNLYVVGWFTSASITFGSSTLINSGMSDVFLVKYDPSGNVLWARNMGGADGDVGNGVVADASGNVYITGWFTSASITFGSGTITNAGTGSSDVFVAKYDASGNPLWARSAGGSMADRGYDVAADANGNLYLTGWFSSAAIDFGTGSMSNAGSGTNDLFVAKFDASGNTQWARRAGGANSDGGAGIVADGNGNSYITGSFASSSIDFGNGPLSNAASGMTDVFFVKYDASGNASWSLAFGGTGDDNGNGLALNGNNAYITGSFGSASMVIGSNVLNNGSPGTNDVFAASYTTSGASVNWAQSAGGPDIDNGNSIAVDASGNAYVTGSFYSANVLFGTISLTNAAPGYRDIFVASYGPAGNVAWAVQAGNVSEETGNGVSVSGTGDDIYIAGMFNSATLTFGSYTIFKGCGDDVFAAKLGSMMVGVDDDGVIGMIEVYPNPGNGMVTVLIPDDGTAGSAQIEVFDQLGRQIYESMLVIGKNEMDLMHFCKGIYYYRVTATETVSGKLVIR
ncbi:MAG: SBBP repeat-containing protein [Bacteroidota bacterium]